MSKDIQQIVGDWNYDSEDESKNVRLIDGDDGRPKIQVRIPGGLVQWEVAGRPDGVRPHGFESLLRYLQLKLQKEGQVSFDEALHQALDEEVMAFYRRRVAFFRLGEFERARSDAEHNLAIMDFLKKHCSDPKKVTEHEKWRPFVVMDRYRAMAMASIKKQDYAAALEALDQGTEEISEIYRSTGREEVASESQEVRALQDFKFYLREIYDLGVTPREMLKNLKAELEKAIEREDFERAAELHKEIRRLQQS